MTTKSRIATFAFAALAALAPAAGAFAHAHVSPPVVLARTGQVFTLAVPTEKDGATTTTIELTPPKGFSIDSFFPAPGWKRTVLQTGSGDSAVVTKVTWSGGAVPTGEDAAFSFLAQTDATGAYTFSVRQTYSDGTVVDWSGPESSDAPAPRVTSVSSLGGGGGSSTLAIVALALGTVAFLVAIAGLVAKGGRALT
ncbi:MAG TPA: DUF1775 domain-containing protein [Gaiellaceae bacterium]|jgi:uncharacterized protein YcnI|nr:DUF1775 domain-containing protein [Gaiellaceae bacterium]